MRHSIAAALALGLASTSALASGFSVPMDEVRTVTFAKPVTTVYVGNPSIADINMIDSRHAFLLGKSFGATNIIALDSAGREVSNVPVSVSGQHGGGMVTLTKGTTQTTLACGGSRCEAAPQPGDSNFAGIMGDVTRHMEMGAHGSQ